jgi:hypothetical protein
MLSNGNGEGADATVYSKGMDLHGGYGKLASVAEVIGGML